MAIKALFSVVSPEEAAAIAHIADVVDVKDAAKGPMAAPSVKTARKVVNICRDIAPVSIALGEVTGRNTKGLLKLARSMAETGAEIFKVCVSGSSSVSAVPVIFELRQVIPPPLKIIAVAYADPRSPAMAGLEELPFMAAASGFDGVMIDTRVKNGRSVFSHIKAQRLAAFVAESRGLGLITAVSGSLGMDDLADLAMVSPDYAGFRSAIATGLRGESGVDIEQAEMIKIEIARIESATAMAG